MIPTEKKRIYDVVALAQSAQLGVSSSFTLQSSVAFQASKETKKVNVDPEFPDRNVIIGAGLSDK